MSITLSTLMRISFTLFYRVNETQLFHALVLHLSANGVRWMASQPDRVTNNRLIILISVPCPERMGCVNRVEFPMPKACFPKNGYAGLWILIPVRPRMHEVKLNETTVFVLAMGIQNHFHFKRIHILWFILTMLCNQS